MLMLYGCIPPWLKTNKNLTCEVDLQIKDSKFINLDKLLQLYLQIQTFEMFTLFPDDCPKPCITMDIKVKVVRSGTGIESEADMFVWKSNQVNLNQNSQNLFVSPGMLKY